MTQVMYFRFLQIFTIQTWKPWLCICSDFLYLDYKVSILKIQVFLSKFVIFQYNSLFYRIYQYILFFHDIRSLRCDVSFSCILVDRSTLCSYNYYVVVNVHMQYKLIAEKRWWSYFKNTLYFCSFTNFFNYLNDCL